MKMIQSMKSGPLIILSLCPGYRTVEDDVSESLYLHRIAQESWGVVKELYADKNNMTRMYYLDYKIGSLRQGNKSFDFIILSG